MIIKQKDKFKPGYNPITNIGDKDKDTMMDFGILILEKGQVDKNNEGKERAFLLIKGEVVFEWEGNITEVKRQSFLDENPWCLHIPAGVEVKITALSGEAEICVTKTYNERNFESKLYTDKDCRVEHFGKGTLGETSTRIVRTIFDISNADYANLVVGEVVNFPGKWSSYPPHYHPQPEIYYYKFVPEQGFGYSESGEEVYKVRNNDTALILNNVTHSQVAAPGYAMFYVWVIRNLDDNPFNERIFVPEHKWLLDKDAKIWPEK
ncbi:MAG TPA: 5-deoxy-glucuronate isomerase [Clostridiaceae bacterium]|nr:5-deoxy-glucuronate isomerase [Clostridiaceae bacterium]